MQVKRIEVKPRFRFSLQKHLKRSEQWIVISGRGVVTLGRKKILVKRGSFIDFLDSLEQLRFNFPAASPGISRLRERTLEWRDEAEVDLAAALAAFSAQ